MIENQAQGIKLDVVLDHGAHVVTMEGSLADDGNNQAKEVLLKVLGSRPARIVVDLEGTDYISSSGIGVLVSMLRRCRQGKVPLVLCSLRPEILELFKLTRLDQVFDLRENRAAALH